MSTPEEKFADEFDCDLFHLISKAEFRGERDKHWLEVAARLRHARIPVRRRMNPKDREAT